MCSENLVLWNGLFKLEVWSVKQGLIPHVGQLLLPVVSVDRWIIDTDVHVILAGPWDVVRLPTHNREIIHPVMMICGIAMVIDWGRNPEIFPKPILKHDRIFSIKYANHNSIFPV